MSLEVLENSHSTSEGEFQAGIAFSSGPGTKERGLMFCPELSLHSGSVQGAHAVEIPSKGRGFGGNTGILIHTVSESSFSPQMSFE